MQPMGTDPISAKQTRFESGLWSTEEAVRLRVLHWRPTNPSSDIPLVFVPGWVSVVGGWADLLRVIAAKREVVYIESREKASAVIEQKRLKPCDFCIERMADDLVQVCSKLPLRMDRAVVAGSSLGATTVLEALKHRRLTARGAFLIGPNSEFRAPWFARGLFLLPSFGYHVVKYFALWYLRTFRVDTKKEPEQMKRYDDTLRSAHPLRIKLSAKAAVGYQIWSDLNTVDIPVDLAYAPSDMLHSQDNILNMAKTLPHGKIVSCPSNKYMHSADLADDIDRFITSLD